MEYTQEIRVLYSDTDAYGVVWHGAYTKWFEAGRAGIAESLGLKLEELENNNILFPVVEMNIRYKSSAKIHEIIIIKTKISEVKPVSVAFEHKVFGKNTNILKVTARTSIVASDGKTGKLYRKMPDNIYSKFISGTDK